MPWVQALRYVQLRHSVIHFCVIGEAVSCLVQHILCGVPFGDAEGRESSRG